jgi:hypothetical protein
MSEIIQQHIDLTRHLIADGPKFRSHTIVIQHDRAYLKPTISALIFCLVYVVVGLFLMGLATVVYFQTQQTDLVVFIAIFGAAILTFGIMLVKPFARIAQFNKITGEFSNYIDRSVKLKNIISLQITNKIVKRKHGLNYPCYELNVVTRYGRRVNILNHNDLEKMQSDGQQLSEFLEVELYDFQKEIVL